MTHRNNLDFLRFILALSVVIFHTVGVWMPAHIWWGGAAVSAFLGISGFVVLQSREASKDLGHFWWKRVLRIYPLFIPVLIVGWFIQPVPVLEYVGHFLSAGIYGRSVAADPGWTIIVEEILYAGLCLLWATGAYRAKWPVWALLVVSLIAPHLTRNLVVERALSLPPAFFVGNLVWLYRDKIGEGMKDAAWVLAAFSVLGVALPALMLS